MWKIWNKVGLVLTLAVGTAICVAAFVWHFLADPSRLADTLPLLLGSTLALIGTCIGFYFSSHIVSTSDEQLSEAQSRLDEPYSSRIDRITRESEGAGPLGKSIREERSAGRPHDEIPERDAGGFTVSEVAAESLVQPAWTVARGTLERYWARNLVQNAFIFWTSITASGLGFMVMLWGVSTSIYAREATSGSILAAASGALTQVVGATFLVIYRSTAAQATDFNRTLERINSVGMAWYILQTMSEGSENERVAKDAAKATLASTVALAGGNSPNSLGAQSVSKPKKRRVDTSPGNPRSTEN